MSFDMNPFEGNEAPSPDRNESDGPRARCVFAKHMARRVKAAPGGAAALNAVGASVCIDNLWPLGLRLSSHLLASFRPMTLLGRW